MDGTDTAADPTAAVAAASGLRHRRRLRLRLWAESNMRVLYAYCWPCWRVAGGTAGVQMAALLARASWPGGGARRHVGVRRMALRSATSCTGAADKLCVWCEGNGIRCHMLHRAAMDSTLNAPTALCRVVGSAAGVLMAALPECSKLQSMQRCHACGWSIMDGNGCHGMR